jgi:probable DNA metabolism protein
MWRRLNKRLGHDRCRMIYEAYLSAKPGIETLLLRYVQSVLTGRHTKASIAVKIELEKLSRRIRREAHRIKGFARFMRTGQDEYMALIAPRYDILPLVREHFESRFADQRWLVYDTRRRYGLYYDQKRASEVRMADVKVQTMRRERHVDELRCQNLWRRYYKAVNIQQRDNPSLHLRQLPRRFWHYLPEKQPS